MPTRLEYISISSWPKLIWVAQLQAHSDVARVIHGPMVEISDEWMFEGCWAGTFEEGAFDQTDLVFGSGLRIRDGSVVFVPSGTVCDRIWWHSANNITTVSNSLFALLWASKVDLLPDYDYTSAISTIRHGLAVYERILPVKKGTINVQYFHNLIWNGEELVEVEKPLSSNGFKSFNDYANYLTSTASTIGSNAASPGRRNPVRVLTTVSRGYDSLVGAVLAKRHMGCGQAVTIRESSSMWRGTDSGTQIAKKLSLECKEYPRKMRSLPLEETFWAMSGKAMEVNWAQFDYPEPLCLFITGVHGDTTWGAGGDEPEDPFASPSLAGRGICEFRLLKGIFHCPVPYWGLRHFQDIRRVSESNEMRPWSVGGTYDRPVARRIVEEAGVPRKMFGIVKMNTQVAPYFLWPYSRNAQISAARYARSVGVSFPVPQMVKLLRLLALLEGLLYMNLLKPFGIPRPVLPWGRIKQKNILFNWANESLKKMIQAKTPSDCAVAVSSENFIGSDDMIEATFEGNCCTQ